MLVVFGATGSIGGQVLRHLQDQGADVRAVARTQAKADELGSVVADLADPSTLPQAVAGADHVFVSTTASHQQAQIESNLVDTLAGTGTHLVELAAMGYDAVPVDQTIALSASHARRPLSRARSTPRPATAGWPGSTPPTSRRSPRTC